MATKKKAKKPAKKSEEEVTLFHQPGDAQASPLLLDCTTDRQLLASLTP